MEEEEEIEEGKEKGNENGRGSKGCDFDRDGGGSECGVWETG